MKHSKPTRDLDRAELTLNEERIDRIIGMMISGAWSPGASMRALAKEWSLSIRATEDAMRLNVLRIWAFRAEVPEGVAFVRALQKRFACPVLALSQLNRDKQRSGWQAYRLEDLRESGAIEQDAFGVLFVHRDDAEQKAAGVQDGKADIIVAKCRQSGSTGRVELVFDGPTTRFSEANEDVWATSGYDDVMSFGPTDYD